MIKRLSIPSLWLLVASITKGEVNGEVFGGLVFVATLNPLALQHQHQPLRAGQATTLFHVLEPPVVFLRS